MALQEARLAIRFAGGLDTQEDDKHVAITDLLALENAVFIRNATIAKRNGFAALERTSLDGPESLPTARATAKRGSELLAFDNNAGYTRVASANGWKRAGDIVCPVLSHAPVAERSREQTMADKATLSGVTVYVWTEEDGAYLAAFDVATGRSLLSPTRYLADGIKTRAAVVGGVLMAFALDTVNHRIYRAIVSPQNPTAVPTADILVENVDATANDYDVHTGSTRTVIAWYDGSVTAIRLGYVHESGVLGSPVTSLPSVLNYSAVLSGPIAVAMNNDTDQRIHLVFLNSTTVLRTTFDYALTGAVSAVSVGTEASCTRLSIGIKARAGEATAGDALVAWDDDDATDPVATLVSVNEAGTVGTPVEIRGTKIAGRPFVDGDGTDDRMFVPVAFESTLFTTLFVVRDDGLVVARILPGVYGGAPSLDCVPNTIADADDDRVHSFAAVYRTRLEGLNGDVYTERGIQDVSLDFGAADSHQTTEVAKTAYLAGAGFLWAYDGEGFAEQGFHYAPDDIAAPVLGSPAGTGIANGTRLYRFAYGWKNAQGEIEWGPTSAGVSVTISSGPDKATFQLPTLRHTCKTAPRADALIGVFRSIDGDEQSLYAVSSLDPTTAGAVNGYVQNDPTVDSVEFVDEMTDETLLSQDPIYTNGGTVSNDPTPTSSVVTSAKDRLFATDPSDASILRYGQVRRDGYLVEISPVLQSRFDSAGGPVTAAVQMDGAIIVFKRRSIFRLGGAGPNSGNQGSFDDPALLHADVGAIDARIVVPMPLGIFFLSEKGFRLLDRSGQVHYIGDKIEKYTDSRRDPQTYVSAEILPDRNEIRVLTAAGVSLHYDYFRNRWSTWPNVYGTAAEIVDGSYYYVRADGDVYVETPSIYRDVNRHVPLAVETSWVKFAGYLQGWQRIWSAIVIGNYRSPCQLRFRAAYDYNDSWVTDLTIDPTDAITSTPYGSGGYGDGPYGGESDSLLQAEFHLDTECQAAKFRIEDVEASGVYGAAFELSEILVTGGVQAVKAVVRAERQG